jgi:hypothetical protein
VAFSSQNKTFRLAVSYTRPKHRFNSFRPSAIEAKFARLEIIVRPRQRWRHRYFEYQRRSGNDAPTLEISSRLGDAHAPNSEEERDGFLSDMERGPMGSVEPHQQPSRKAVVDVIKSKASCGGG